MNDATDNTRRPQPDAGHIVRSLNLLLASSRSGGEIMEAVVREARASIDCDHIFLNRYNAGAQVFRAVAWQSSISPGDVPLDHKFMGNSYLAGQSVVIHDLSQYNYRLRPGMARRGFLSMVGIPIMTKQGFAGVLEAFSEEAGHFSDMDAELLALFARIAGIALEAADFGQEAGYRETENGFLLEAMKLEQASVGSLFYKVGETFASVLGVDGIAVFGIEQQAADNPLQEVMAKGFSMPDISRLKSLYSKEYLQKLLMTADGQRKGRIVKQSFRQGGGGAPRLLYTVPIEHRCAMYGLVVFYWQQMDKTVDASRMEAFIERMIGYITLILGRKDIYNNIQRISFFDLLTGLANRRLFDYVLDRELKKVRRTAKPVSLLMADIDYFKNINDVYGHQAGDSVLEHIGAILKDSLRNVDLPARYGGEEFAIIMPETDRDQAIMVSERLRARVADYKFPVGRTTISVTISVGGATCGPRDSADISAERVILAADQALYQAKQMGRNITVFANNF